MGWVWSLTLVSLMLGDDFENLEVVGERLAGATRVLDGDRHLCTGSQRESHGHPMIIVGVDSCHVQPLWRCYDAVVGPFLDRCTQLKHCLGWQQRDVNTLADDTSSISAKKKTKMEEEISSVDLRKYRGLMFMVYWFLLKNKVRNRGKSTLNCNSWDV